MFKKQGPPIDVLIVEDDMGDAELLMEALAECCIDTTVKLTRHGLEALEFLYRKGEFNEAPRPDLIFLDLNMPKKDGREVLAEIKRDNDLMTIPVLVLTTSQAEADIVTTYRLHGNCFLTKPQDMNGLTDLVRRIEEFWFDAVKLMPKRQH